MADTIKTDPFKTYELLCNSYIRYIQTIMGFNSEKLEEERDRLLRKNGLLFQEPRFEPIFPYPSSEKTLSQLSDDLKLPSQLGEFLAVGGKEGLAPIDRTLYEHQAEAIKASVIDGEDVVVTTGTGSGKTECFLLPIFNYLIEESQDWTSYGKRNIDHPWWRTHERSVGIRVPQRKGETRPAAIRALILYPLNALVEDQLMRLRRACDSPEARQWLNNNRGNNRFYFGRYNSLTPVSGKENSDNIKKLRDKLDDLRKQFEKVKSSPEKRYFFPSTDVDTSEMWTRWDMRDHPPDIFITNYSMLNIMLTRDLEQPIFEKTKEWLEQPDSIFHLVVDELHSYRGTSGSEVAFLLRTLFNRLGLDPDSPKLRIIGSSASLEGGEGREYLRQFFARGKNFKIIGSPPHPDKSAELRECLNHAKHFEIYNTESDSTELDNIPKDIIKSAVAQLCNCNGKLHASTVEDMLEAANKVTSTSITKGTIRGLIRYLIQQRDSEANQALLPLRVHYFFKNYEGLWACSNPKCQGEHEDATIGKLFANRRVLCDQCGSRVLELLTCETCGDLFLGGYKQQISDKPPSWYLSGDYQELTSLPEKGIRDRNYETYAIFWQRKQTPEPGRPWGKHGVQRRWAPGHFNHAEGKLTRNSANYNGYFYNIDQPEDWCSEIPKYCPNCGDAWDHSNKPKPISGKEETYSPLHDMGTGLQKVIQILTQTLQATVKEQSKRKTIIFSDSRQDAAKYAVGLQWAHYRDMIRLIVIETMKRQTEDSDFSILRDLQNGYVTQEEARDPIQRLITNFPDEQSIFWDIYDGKSLTTDQKNQLIALEGDFPFTVLQEECFKEFINLGMNPGGYGQKVDSSYNGDSWLNLCDWERDPAVLRPNRLLESHQKTLIKDIESEFKRVIAERILFARKDMGLEGLGLAWCEPKINPDKWKLKNVNPTQIMASVTRILGERKYTNVNPFRSEEKNMPKFVENYLVNSATQLKCKPEELTKTIGEQIEASSTFDGYLIRVEDLSVRLSQSDTVYRCSKCKRKHLYKAGGICTNTKCLGTLEEIDKNSDKLEQYGGYYAYQVDPEELGIQPYRFHCEELTAQTDSEERPNRQRWFQDVILDDENEKTDTIDLLSVTTTMEAGVDIGSLSIVLMGNVPPQRFNYQQRVGRAGRRGEPIAYSLTLCRLRTHDDHYFSHTNEITNDETPQPYLDLRSTDIIKRVLTKEVLFHAFPRSDTENANERNVHGNFGKVSNWSTNRDKLSKWIQTRQETIPKIVQVLTAQTELETENATDELTDWVINKLENEIDTCINGHLIKDDDLSQALAESGLLPMFGFPTGVRFLYHQQPRKSNWPPTSGIVDRNIDIAINQFAPGAETVKDKKIHTSIGIVSYIPEGKTMGTESDIGREQPIGFCESCKAVFTDSIENKDNCGICSDDKFKLIQGIEPKGFLTNFKPDDAHENFNWAPRATYSRLPSDIPAKLTTQHNFRSGVKSNLKLFSINTNNDRLFKLRKQQDSDALVSAEVCRELAQKSGRHDFKEDAHLEGKSRDVALYASTTTDILLIEVDEIPEGTLGKLQGEYWRAASYSFGFLFRQFVANRLDVSPTELRVEIRPVKENGIPKQQIFIADALANGAGYCRYIGETDSDGQLRLLTFLRDMVDPEKDFAKRLIDHSEDCDSSCYNKGCMRDYSNMPYHPFLDWRLGLDVARLCVDKEYQMDLQTDYWISLVKRVAKNLVGLPYNLEYKDHNGVPVFEDPTQHRAFILHHPLASTEEDWAGPHVADATVDLEDAGFNVEYINIFDAIRRVSVIINILNQKQ